MDRKSIFAWVKQSYGTDPEYLWQDTPWNAVLRNHESNKWYAIVMKVEESKLGISGNQMIDILDIKCDPNLIGALRQRPGFFPGYHMNKNSWITILLDGTVPEEEIKNLLDLSYQLTQPKKKDKKMEIRK